MLRADVRPEVIAKDGGWGSVTMVHDRYGRHVLPEREASAARLDAYRESLRQSAP